MKEFILCKYGEIVLKGLNKSSFERILMKEVRGRLSGLGSFEVSYSQSTLYIEPLDADADLEEALRRIKRVFGIATVTRAFAVEKDLATILASAREYLPPVMAGASTFRVEGKRSDKSFPLTSPELAGEVGAELLEAIPGIKVSLDHPDITVRVEIREKYAFIHASAEKAAGGIPYGSGGRALLLLSGGIDSPVAGYLMAKRGATVEALHFESMPYTSELAKEKVMTLAGLLCEYTGRMRVNVISLTRIQEEIRRGCDEDYFTLLLRRSMMRLAERTAELQNCDALVTGESLGQVASQTMKALTVTDSVVSRPVFRPCIGLDKEEIITYARNIGTFGTSIIPYEDCCTVFTPRHPKTQPELAKELEQEAKIDFKTLEDEAFANIEKHFIKVY